MRWGSIPPQIIVDHNLCIQCLKCVRSCPAEILVQENRTQKGQILVSDPSLCFECRACEVICPESAIKVMCVIALSAP